MGALSTSNMTSALRLCICEMWLRDWLCDSTRFGEGKDAAGKPQYITCDALHYNKLLASLFGSSTGNYLPSEILSLNHIKKRALFELKKRSLSYCPMGGSFCRCGREFSTKGRFTSVFYLCFFIYLCGWKSDYWPWTMKKRRNIPGTRTRLHRVNANRDESNLQIHLSADESGSIEHRMEVFLMMSFATNF